MTDQDIFKRLREHMDSTMPVGYPATNSGVELRILKHVFTEKEAELACHLQPFPETAQEIAHRIGRDVVEVTQLLKDMVKKGTVFNSVKGGVNTYRPEWFVIGIYENQVTRLTKEFAEDFEQYVEEALRDEILTVETPQLRVVPVNASITPTMEVASYDDVRQLILQQSKLAVAECICKKEKAILGKGCDNPREVCLVFSTGAYHYIENGLGREITHEEALEIIDLAEKSGLVLSPGNAQKTFAICCCCGCCCAILSNLKKLPKPNLFTTSNYFAQSDPELCSGCETCLDRCQMDAITIQKGIATINLDRCIGCGLCITTCPEKALSLKKKEKSKIKVPPATAMELYMKLGTERQEKK